MRNAEALGGTTAGRPVLRDLAQAIALTVVLVLVAAAIAFGIAAIDAPTPVTASNIESVTAHPLGRGLQQADGTRNVDYGVRHLASVGGVTMNEDYGLRHLAD